jgi:hypothetical protein
MKLVKFAVCFGTLAMAFASAGERYNVTLHQTTLVAGTELKPGDYKIEVNGDKATIISSNKKTVETAVKVENSDQKFANTTVRYATANGSYKIDEIHVGGTKTKLVFDSGEQASAR